MRKMRLKRTMIIVVVLLLFIMNTSCQRHAVTDLESMVIEESAEESKDTQDKSLEDTDSMKEQQEDTASEATCEICVYICGAVQNPGVYTFDKEVRIYEVLEQAGGLSEDASDTYLNQAQQVSDGEQIYVPTRQEVEAGLVTSEKEGQQPGTQTGNDSGKININTASREELMKLNGIGETRANSIISYRESQGSFQSIEDIMQIEGIKEGVFSKIKEDITV